MTTQASHLSTGIAGLDAILGGGFATGALIFIVGPPGSGKTVLGSTIIFTVARSEIPSLILSAYSEGHDKLLQHLQGFTFFDPSQIGTMVRLMSLNDILTEEGGVNQLIDTIRAERAQFVLIDGFQGLLPLSRDPDSVRRMLSSLSSQLSYIGVTVVVTLAGDVHDLQFHPVLTTADLVIGLHYGLEKLNHVRYIEVVKVRGQAQLPGLHPYQIQATGLRVLPRIESYPEPSTRPRPSGRAPFGLPEFDELLQGGLTAGTTTVLAGAVGSGKTTLALHWGLQGAQPDAVSIYVTFREYPEQLQLKSETFGLRLAEATASGALRIVRIPPVELVPDEVANTLLDMFHTLQVRRLIIDDIGLLLRALGDRARDYCAALVEHFYGEGVTTLCTMESNPLEGPWLNLTDQPVALLAENLLVIYQEESAGRVRHLLTVLQMRFSSFDRSLRELTMDANGVRVLDA
ncbi:MAG: hypothetical protein H7Y32_17640 [Chloroflexales bacterium]|nr:hypothetical protein [Chloroflexales bacterium]